MDKYYWQTEEPLSDNDLTMSDWINFHMPDDFEIMNHDGTYAEVKTPNGVFAVHASGDGDFCNHKVEFVEITYQKTVVM